MRTMVLVLAAVGLLAASACDFSSAPRKTSTSTGGQTTTPSQAVPTNVKQGSTEVMQRQLVIPTVLPVRPTTAPGARLIQPRPVVPATIRPLVPVRPLPNEIRATIKRSDVPIRKISPYKDGAQMPSGRPETPAGLGSAPK